MRNPFAFGVASGVGMQVGSPFVRGQRPSTQGRSRESYTTRVKPPCLWASAERGDWHSLARVGFVLDPLPKLGSCFHFPRMNC